MKVIALIPIKMNNERTPGKNTKALSDGTPLIHCIQRTLLGCSGIDEVYVYCSKEEIKQYLLPGIKFIKRSSELDTSATDMLTILQRFSDNVDADIYVLSHATAPFLSCQTIDKAVNAVKSGMHDSAFSAKKIQGFLWKDNSPMNYSLEHVPRTQDIEPIWEETAGVYVYTKHVIRDLHRRIGENPYMIEVPEIESVDIDTPDDFLISDAIYSYLANTGKKGNYADVSMKNALQHRNSENAQLGNMHNGGGGNRHPLLMLHKFASLDILSGGDAA